MNRYQVTKLGAGHYSVRDTQATGFRVVASSDYRRFPGHASTKARATKFAADLNANGLTAKEFLA